MPWHVVAEHSACPASRPYAVVKDADGSVAGCHKSKGEAQAHMAALYANVKEAQMPQNETREVRTLPLADLEIRHTGKTTEGFTVVGYPAVYGQRSLDLGGFTEIIHEGAFDRILSTNPDVHFVWDHDTRFVGARTRNGTLRLSSDAHGLRMEAEVGNYSWAKDLRVALERKDIDQGSFSFSSTGDGSSFEIDDNNNVTHHLRDFDAVYDVTVTAQGAYPQTSLALARSLAAATHSGDEPEAPSDPVVAEGGTPPSGEASEGDPEWEMLRAQSLVRSAELKTLAERLRRL